MRSGISLEESVFILKAENERLRAEAEGLHLKNKLLLELTEGGKGSPPRSQETKWAERLKSDHEEQTAQLKQVIDRLKAANQELENERQELIEELDKAAEREIGLEEQLEKGQNDYNDTMQELEDFKTSLRTLFPSSDKPSDLQGLIQHLETRESELSNWERELDKRERILNEKTNSLREKENRLLEQESRLKPRDRPADPGDAAKDTHIQQSHVYGAESVSLQGTLKDQSEVASERILSWSKRPTESRFLAAKEKAKQKRENGSRVSENQHTIEEERPSRHRESSFEKKSSHTSHEASQLSNRESSREKREVFLKSQAEAKDDFDAGEEEEQFEPNKMTFNPSSMSHKVLGGQSQREVLEDFEAEKRFSSFGGNQIESVEKHDRVEDSQFVWNPTASHRAKPVLPERPDHLPKAEESGKPSRAKNSSFEVEEFHIEDPADDSKLNPDQTHNSIQKKAIAFDLFDESIDEKKRQQLIQKLERKRSGTRETKQGNLIPKKSDPPVLEKPSKEVRDSEYGPFQRKPKDKNPPKVEREEPPVLQNRSVKRSNIVQDKAPLIG